MIGNKPTKRGTRSQKQPLKSSQKQLPQKQPSGSPSTLSFTTTSSSSSPSTMYRNQNMMLSQETMAIQDTQPLYPDVIQLSTTTTSSSTTSSKSSVLVSVSPPPPKQPTSHSFILPPPNPHHLTTHNPSPTFLPSMSSQSTIPLSQSQSQSPCIRVQGISESPISTQQLIGLLYTRSPTFHDTQSQQPDHNHDTHDASIDTSIVTTTSINPSIQNISTQSSTHTPQTVHESRASVSTYTSSSSSNLVRLSMIAGMCGSGMTSSTDPSISIMSSLSSLESNESTDTHINPSKYAIKTVPNTITSNRTVGLDEQSLDTDLHDDDAYLFHLSQCDVIRHPLMNLNYPTTNLLDTSINNITESLVSESPTQSRYIMSQQTHVSSSTNTPSSPMEPREVSPIPDQSEHEPDHNHEPNERDHDTKRPKQSTDTVTNPIPTLHRIPSSRRITRSIASTMPSQQPTQPQPHGVDASSGYRINDMVWSYWSSDASYFPARITHPSPIPSSITIQYISDNSIHTVPITSVYPFRLTVDDRIKIVSMTGITGIVTDISVSDHMYRVKITGTKRGRNNTRRGRGRGKGVTDDRILDVDVSDLAVDETMLHDIINRSTVNSFNPLILSTSKPNHVTKTIIITENDTVNSKLFEGLTFILSVPTDIDPIYTAITTTSYPDTRTISSTIGIDLLTKRMRPYHTDQSYHDKDVIAGTIRARGGTVIHDIHDVVDTSTGTPVLHIPLTSSLPNKNMNQSGIPTLFLISPKPRRTTKHLISILLGIPIISPAFIYACVHRNMVVPYDWYRVPNGFSYEMCWWVSPSRSICGDMSGVFRGIKVLVVDTDTPSTTTSSTSRSISTSSSMTMHGMKNMVGGERCMVHDVLVCGGAEIINKNPITISNLKSILSSSSKPSISTISDHCDLIDMLTQSHYLIHVSNMYPCVDVSQYTRGVWVSMEWVIQCVVMERVVDVWQGMWSS